MNRVKFFTVILAVSFILCLGLDFLSAGLQSDSERDLYGKLICQIVDEETGEPVKEAFEIVFFDSKDNTYPNNLIKKEKTDQNGRLVLEVPPYPFYLQFYPGSENSKYCISPYPYYMEKDKRTVVQTETGKITNIQKKVSIGGTLKIYMADMNNNRFNPQEKFKQKFYISTTIGSDIYWGISSGRDDLNDGELIATRLHPGL